MIKKFISHNKMETDRFAEKLAKQLCGGKVVLLYGDLGAGKTTFSKSLIKYLGYSGVVTSPTFTILNEYQGKYKINHFDMYRLENEDEAQEIGFEEIISDANAVSIIEWPQRVSSLLPSDAIKIEIKVVDANAREFILEAENENFII